MCAVSNVGDMWGRTFPARYPDWVRPNTTGGGTTIFPPNEVSRVEFDALKAELESLKKLLLAAKQYDKDTGQPDCEDEEKVRLFKQLANVCGVDLSAIFQTH